MSVIKGIVDSVSEPKMVKEGVNEKSGKAWKLYIANIKVGGKEYAIPSFVKSDLERVLSSFSVGSEIVFELDIKSKYENSILLGTIENVGGEPVSIEMPVPKMNGVSYSMYQLEVMEECFADARKNGRTTEYILPVAIAFFNLRCSPRYYFEKEGN